MKVAYIAMKKEEAAHDFMASLLHDKREAALAHRAGAKMANSSNSAARNNVAQAAAAWHNGMAAKAYRGDA